MRAQGLCGETGPLGHRGMAAQSGLCDQVTQTRISPYAVPKRIDREPGHLPISFLDSPFQPRERLILLSQSKTYSGAKLRRYVLPLGQLFQLRQKLSSLSRLTCLSVGKSQTRIAPKRIADGL